jgi:hypothetical protein
MAEWLWYPVGGHTSAIEGLIVLGRVMGIGHMSRIEYDVYESCYDG